MSLPKSNGQTLLITGINGYIASVLGHLLLTKGYNVRGTARKAASTHPLLDRAYAAFKERVEIFEVPDMTIPGAFDEAVKGVHGIFHVASPIDSNMTTYESTVETAIAGNLSLLNSALTAAGSQLKSVTVTSSVAAISNPPVPAGHTLNESQFAYVALERAKKDKEEGVQSPFVILYNASKTAAERALWEFKELKKPDWSITSINPTVVIGPPILVPSTAAKLNITLQPIWAILSGEAKTLPSLVGSGAYVDVRDVAEAHLWSYENYEAADGERYITAAGCGMNQAIADILREAYPKRRDVIVAGEPGVGYEGYGKGFVDYAPGAVICDGGKAERTMGLKYRDLKTSLVDTAKAFEELL